MIKHFRVWSARFLLFLGVLVIILGALSLNLTPIVAGAVLLGLGHGILAVHELSAQTKALLGVAQGALRRERTYESPPPHVASDEPAGPGLRDDSSEPVDAYAAGSRSARA